MKRPEFLCVLAIAICSIQPVAARADDEASHKAAADELLQVLHSEKSLDHVTEQMKLSVERMTRPGATSATPQEVAAYQESVRQQSVEIIKEQLSWEKFEPDVAQLYADAFTEPELKTLIEFYKTPVGQKLVSTQTELAGKVTVLTQQKVRTVFTALTQKVRENSAKFRADHPVKVIPPLIAAPGRPRCTRGLSLRNVCARSGLPHPAGLIAGLPSVGRPARLPRRGTVRQQLRQTSSYI